MKLFAAAFPSVDASRERVLAATREMIEVWGFAVDQAESEQYRDAAAIVREAIRALDGCSRSPLATHLVGESMHEAGRATSTPGEPALPEAPNADMLPALRVALAEQLERARPWPTPQHIIAQVGGDPRGPFWRRLGGPTDREIALLAILAGWRSLAERTREGPAAYVEAAMRAVATARSDMKKRARSG